MQPAKQILPRPLMGRLVGLLVLVRHLAPALGSDSKLPAPPAEELPDELLAASVIIGGIYEVDARIQHRVENRVCLLFGYRPPAPDARATHLHRPVAERRDFQARAPQCPFFQ